MKKIVLLLMAGFILNSSVVYSVEGMWLPFLIKRLNEADMRAKGLQLTAEELYNVNNSSLKDAIVSLGGFCTAEVVSPEGLILTNHHCGFEAIQSQSSVENDYLTNGFWAYKKSEELASPGLTAAFLVRIEDVSEKINKMLTWEMTEDERAKIIGEQSKIISDESVAGTHYNADVETFFNGNEFYLFVYETFRDVRLVGAPPSAIGKFGGDTDNWMWPRHTGDFSMLRVYSGPDGKPADYSESNIPMKSKHFLPISLDGVKEGDFSMVFGYPGSTDRYLSSYGVKQAIDVKNPTTVSIRDLKLKIIKEDSDADAAVRIKYAAKYAQTANYWKYFIGETKGLKRLKVFDQKKETENKFTTWANENPERKKKYGEALNSIAQGYATSDKSILNSTYLFEAGLLGTDIVRFAYRFNANAQKALAEVDAEKKAKLITGLKKRAKDFFVDYNQPTDKRLFAALFEKYSKNVPADQQPAFMNTVKTKFKDDYKKFAENAYAKSFMDNEVMVNGFIDNLSKKKLDNDPLIKAANDVFAIYFAETEKDKEMKDKQARGERLFLAGLREMQPDKNFYPDANSTMRMTYGSIGDYAPADGVMYDYTTTLDGVMEKEDATNEEFLVPAKLSELYYKKDFGQYADKNGKIITCFISDNDITGGNSGSPVINGRGELIGIAFDGNWEAMSGNIAFEPRLQKTISVDIRYVMFIIDKYAGAKNLIDEMKIVKTTASTITSQEKTTPALLRD
jgi:Peptidase S46